ncbi:sulfurtransferase [Zhengella mangrovi]|uniref:Sulfurtransferase n=1 Tax=Zhengella mangrovi TaxID=1982044 RepID=A0A2G1QS64_9HYPH|nr:rhodanese-like domain-containing protein [Zhengella mangrovi]PHP68300.1 sulfurtransferase [Zhengella mangrovi]
MLSGLMKRLTSGASDNAIAHDDFLAALKAKTHTLVDVREVREFHSGAIPGAINVPLSAFDPARIPAGKPVILYCATGARSGMALRALHQAGREDAVHYRPGVTGWRLQGGRLV